MNSARGTAIFLIAVLGILWWIVYGSLPKPPATTDEAVKDQGTHFKGRVNTGEVFILPPLSIPWPNYSANCYAGRAPVL
jgi:hypothetical protein